VNCQLHSRSRRPDFKSPPRIPHLTIYRALNLSKQAVIMLSRVHKSSESLASGQRLFIGPRVIGSRLSDDPGLTAILSNICRLSQRVRVLDLPRCVRQ
jgi:hypothetical protein